MIPQPCFGIGLSSAVSTARRTLELAVQADRDGLDLFSVSDHPYFAERLDAYAFLGVALGRTERITGLANVTNLPTRPAPMLSRTVAALTALTEGRIVLGLGVGGLSDEAAKLGAKRLSPGESVRAFEEAMVLIRSLTGAPAHDRRGRPAPVTYEGEFYQVFDLEPSAMPTPPIWTGSVGPKSLAVTGRHADGWLPGHAADWLSERYRTSRPVIDEAAVAAGRDPSAVATVYNFPGVITAEPAAAPRDADGRWVGGSVGQWVEELTGAVLEHGAGGFIYFPTGPADAATAVWAREVVPAVREAVAKG